MDAPPNDNPALKAYESFIRSTPFVTRSLVISQFVTWIISFFALDLSRAFGNVPYFTVFRLEIYRLILSPLIGNSLLLSIFTSISFVEVGSRMEYSTGSTSFAWLLFVMTLAVNTIHIVAAFLLYAITDNRNVLFSESVGLIMLFFGIVSIECFQASPGSSRRLFFTTVPNIYYPWALLAMFTFLAGFQLSLPISIGFGFLFYKGKLDFLKLDNGVFQRWENTSLASLVGRDGWIATDGLRTSDWNEGGPTGGLGPLSQLWGNASSSQEGQTNTTGRSVGFGAASGDAPSTGASGNASNSKTSNFPAGGRTLGTASRRTAVDPRQARLDALERRSNSNANTSQDSSNV